MRLNIGCGDHPLTGWTNLDARAEVEPDVCATVPPLPFEDASCDEVYAGHFLEHLPPADGLAFLRECARVVKPGGRVGILVPDTRAILGVYLGQVPTKVEFPLGTWHDCRDLDAVCTLFLFSTIQESPHRWAYDLDTLGRALQAAGLRVTATIDRFTDPRIPVPAWYQCGLDAVVPPQEVT